TNQHRAQYNRTNAGDTAWTFAIYGFARIYRRSQHSSEDARAGHKGSTFAWLPAECYCAQSYYTSDRYYRCRDGKLGRPILSARARPTCAKNPIERTASAAFYRATWKAR